MKLLLIFVITLQISYCKSVAQMKECLTYVLAFNSDCYEFYSSCLTKQICQDLYIKGRQECSDQFLYDTDTYDGDCIYNKYKTLSNTDAKQLLECLQNQCNIFNNNTQIISILLLIYMIFL